ncbi:hypothetical protein IFM89_025369 [Coptis chinensis]|uniref:DUF642 domain-containing protein n=1 Tax=Coptis chinensis TaxID=261450 RepID=A0A835M9Q8_9MAGN|nr:hypothetical protein IFM89_025369 [Coptis chinensis]
MILIVPQVRAVRLGNDTEISQELKLEKGSLYSITFSAARTCAQLESLMVYRTGIHTHGPFRLNRIVVMYCFGIQEWKTIQHVDLSLTTLPSRSSLLLKKPKDTHYYFYG